MESRSLKIAVIADDLTGSLDTGLQFRKKGLATLVPLDCSRALPDAEALVLNTNSRNLPGDLAYRKVYATSRRIPSPFIYKKIDSTMRGNVGREALAILDARKIAKAIVVPTIPQQGRTVQKGILRVHGIPLLRTPYAKDPFHPLTSSKVPELLRRESKEKVECLPLDEVRKGPDHLARAIEKSPARLLAVDAVLPSDLKSIASACKLLAGRVLACGSVGLADEMGPSAGKAGEVDKLSFQGPVFIISASRNPATGEQIERALKHSRLVLIEPDLHLLTHSRKTKLEIEAVYQKAGEALSRGDGVILSTTFLKHIPGQEATIPRALGKAAVRILEKFRVGGLVLTGGDLAMGICERLSSSALRIEEEVLPAIPCSTLIGGPFQGLRTVTKAGGFGDKDALWNIIRYLRGENET